MHGKRIVALYIIILGMFLSVVLRLYSVSVADTAFEALSGQYTRKIDVAERSGFVYDRDGVPLNMRNAGYVALVRPSQCSDAVEASEKLCEISDLRMGELYDRILEKAPFTVRTKVQAEISGVDFFPFYERVTVSAPHIVGYTDGYGRGASGVLSAFDKTLCERLSEKVSFRYLADARGAVLDSTGGCLHDSGYNEKSGIYLTIDSELQRYCEDIAEGLEGSGVICITDTNTAEVLSCVSFPSFDTSRVAQYLESDKGELINRCFACFTPGSIFKTVVACAALESDLSLYELEYECCGSFVTGDGEIIPCHKKGGHGAVDMKTAYAASCNPYFINLANIIGAEKIIETAEKMGLSGKCSLDGIFSYGSSIPRYDEDISSYEGYIANLAIGQGRMLISPLSACTAFSCAVTGERVDAGILRKVTQGDRVIRDYSGKRVGERVLLDETTECLSEMMRLCVDKGLGIDAKPEKGEAGGKTATAQTGSFKDGKEILNCWFCGVYPASEPRFTVCVLYCGTENNNTAKHIFKDICKKLADLRDISSE